MIIKEIQALEVFDSSGNPTIEVNLIFANEFNELKEYISKVVVPSSLLEVSKYKENRDTDKKRFGRKGVSEAVASINTFIMKALSSQHFNSQEDFDNYLIELDGTKDRSNLGSNTILGLSMAYFKSLSTCKKLKPYELVCQMANATSDFPKPIIRLSSDKNEVPDFSLISLKEDKISENIRKLVEVEYELISNSIDLNNEKKALENIEDVVHKLKYEEDVGIMTREELESKSLIDIKKIGTVSEMFSIVEKLRNDSKKIVLEISSEETEDTLWAHFAIGLSVDHVLINKKEGSEIFAKINEMLRIEKHIKDNSIHILNN